MIDCNLSSRLVGLAGSIPGWDAEVGRTRISLQRVYRLVPIVFQSLALAALDTCLFPSELFSFFRLICSSGGLFVCVRLMLAIMSGALTSGRSRLLLSGVWVQLCIHVLRG